jgi:hypothetical protein
MQIATTTSGRFRHNAPEETRAFLLLELIRLGSKLGVFEVGLLSFPGITNNNSCCLLTDFDGTTAIFGPQDARSS